MQVEMLRGKLDIICRFTVRSRLEINMNPIYEGPEYYTILVEIFGKHIQNYEYKIRCRPCNMSVQVRNPKA